MFRWHSDVFSMSFLLWPSTRKGGRREKSKVTHTSRGGQKPFPIKLRDEAPAQMQPSARVLNKCRRRQLVSKFVFCSKHSSGGTHLRLREQVYRARHLKVGCGLEADPVGGRGGCAKSRAAFRGWAGYGC